MLLATASEAGPPCNAKATDVVMTLAPVEFSALRRVTKDFGGVLAAAMGYLYEAKGKYLSQDNSEADTQMDLHNNQCGRRIGKDEYNDCEFRCMEALDRGILTVIQ